MVRNPGANKSDLLYSGSKKSQNSLKEDQNDYFFELAVVDDGVDDRTLVGKSASAMAANQKAKKDDNLLDELDNLNKVVAQMDYLETERARLQANYMKGLMQRDSNNTLNSE